MADGWQSAVIAGKTADIYEPPGERRFGVLHLHDEDQETLVHQAVFTRLLEQLSLACVCPHGGLSWWTDRICREFDPNISAERYLLQHVLPFFDERWGLKPRAIGVQGIGMGGQGALRLAFKHPGLFPVAAAISPALDYHDLYGEGTCLDEMYESKEQCRQDTALMHVPPSGYPPHLLFCIDPEDHQWYRGNDRLHEKLTALGIPHQFETGIRGGGHSWDYFNRMAERTEQFVRSGLEQESRRLL